MLPVYRSSVTPGPFWTSNVQCSGNEVRLSDCQLTELGTVNQCTSSTSQAGVICFDNEGLLFIYIIPILKGLFITCRSRVWKRMWTKNHCFSFKRAWSCLVQIQLLTHYRRQILDSSKLKEFADNNFKFDENGKKLSKWVENTVGKGEIACDEQFLLFPQCCQKACFPGASKGFIVWEWVK